MKEIQPSFDSKPDYWQLTQVVLDQYAPTARKACKTDSWPDELADHELVICNQTSNRSVAEIDFDASPDGWAYITIPADYTRPQLREPFNGIDSTEGLPEAGELICEIIRLIDLIVMSPHTELTHQRELTSLIEQLHQDHSYSVESIQSEIAEEAKKRGDLPDTDD